MTFVSFEEQPLFPDEGATATTLAGGTSWVPATALSALIGLGTGAFLPYEIGQDQGTVVAKPVTFTSPDFVQEDPEDLFSTPAARLTVVRRWLSMSITDLATAMRVQRPTIYAWMSSRSMPKQANLERLRALHRVGQAWKRRAGRPAVDALKKPTPEGGSLLSLLAAPNIDEVAVLRLIERLARRDKAPTRATRLAAASDFDDTPHDDAESAFDVETLLES